MNEVRSGVQGLAAAGAQDQLGMRALLRLKMHVICNWLADQQQGTETCSSSRMAYNRLAHLLTPCKAEGHHAWVLCNLHVITKHARLWSQNSVTVLLTQRYGTWCLSQDSAG